MMMCQKGATGVTSKFGGDTPKLVSLPEWREHVSMMMSRLVSGTHNALGHPYKAMHHIMNLVANMPHVPELRTSPDARREQPSRQLFVLITITSGMLYFKDASFKQILSPNASCV